MRAGVWRSAWHEQRRWHVAAPAPQPLTVPSAPAPPAGTFRVLLLRKRGSVISAAAVRPFGSKFAGAHAAAGRLLLPNHGIPPWRACLSPLPTTWFLPSLNKQLHFFGLLACLQRCRLWPPKRATGGRATAAS